MDSSLLAFMELLIVCAFVIGWAVVEIVGLRLDRKREQENAEANKSKSSSGDAT